jgi:ATP-binding cassette subfamily C protein LapB
MKIVNEVIEETPASNDAGLMMSTSWAISAVTRLLGCEIDRLRLHDAVSSHESSLNALASYRKTKDASDDLELLGIWQNVMRQLVVAAGLEGIEVQEAPDPARLPALTYVHGTGWGVIRGLSPQNQWLIDTNGQAFAKDADEPLPCVRLIVQSNQRATSDKPVFQLFKKAFLEQKKTISEAAAATVAINLLALMTSLYSMQVYDRVIPTQGYSTLAVLTLGVAISLIFDIVIKVVRSHLMEHTVVQMDKTLSRAIFGRLLQVRLDKLPTGVGTLAGQVRGYETIRGFLSATTFYVFVDAPFGLFFILMIALIGSPIAALVPLVFLVFAIAFGFVMRDRIDSHATGGTNAGNMKTGLLVEAIEGAETIKSGSGAWSMLSKWIDTTEEALHHEMALRRISEKSAYISSLMQQASYIGLIAVGAYLAAEGHMTMGSLIACSILSGRALSPVGQIPGLIVQAGHSKTALEMLEKMFALETDNHGVQRPLVPGSVAGKFDLERVRFAYPGAPKGLSIQNLAIQAGEKVGVIGPIGAGKSTLLRLFSGMYRASEGRILLDGLDIDHISRALLGDRIGYLQQDHRLFSGTLRENLLIGIPDPGDEVIKAAAEKTGLLPLISNHPKGLDLMISEGGKGLSGGQKQLVAFTRLMISKPDIWLLDEPTASMDSATEAQCLRVLTESLSPENTLLLVTHKPTMLALVNRIIVIANNEIVMDGPRDDIIKRLSTPASQGATA